jgi:hypothetical protein
MTEAHGQIRDDSSGIGRDRHHRRKEMRVGRSHDMRLKCCEDAVT